MKRDGVVIALDSKRASPELQARTDDELMRLAAAGMLEAFSELVRRHERAVRGFCARLLASREQGDDATQEVFLEVWRTRARYESRGRFRGLLFSAARNRCLNELRARPAVAFESVMIDARADVTAFDDVDAILAAERRQRLDLLVSRLPPKLRDAIWLRYAAELDYDEIAAILERPAETVRSRVFHGLKQLRRLLGGDPTERS